MGPTSVEIGNTNGKPVVATISFELHNEYAHSGSMDLHLDLKKKSVEVMRTWLIEGGYGVELPVSPARALAPRERAYLAQAFRACAGPRNDGNELRKAADVLARR